MHSVEWNGNTGIQAMIKSARLPYSWDVLFSSGVNSFLVYLSQKEDQQIADNQVRQPGYHLIQ
jgi:hypothetical protein